MKRPITAPARPNNFDMIAVTFMNDNNFRTNPTQVGGAAGQPRSRILTAGSVVTATSQPIIHLWWRERARLLHRICKSIEARLSRGISLERALRWPSWYWKNKTYRTVPGKKVRFSKSTLRRSFYLWRTGGRSPDALVLKYVVGKHQVTPTLAKDFVRANALPEAVSMRSAFRLSAGRGMIPAGISARNLISALPGEVRKVIRETHAVRRTREKALSRQVKNLVNRIK